MDAQKAKSVNQIYVYKKINGFKVYLTGLLIFLKIQSML